MELPKDLKIRHSTPEDHPRIISVMKEWWHGRDLSSMLPRLFLIHFCDTSFIIEKDQTLVAFLIGFFSQSQVDEGYIHFAGVNPAYRSQGIGRFLYNRFFQLCRDSGRTIVRACTSRSTENRLDSTPELDSILKPETLKWKESRFSLITISHTIQKCYLRRSLIKNRFWNQ